MKRVHTNVQGSPKAASPNAVPTLAGIRILVVDDEPELLAIVAQVLTSFGGELTTATSADEALAALKNARPHVILCDLHMPLKDGFAFVRELRSLPDDEGGKTPALAMTGALEDEEFVRAAGFQQSVHKPTPFAELALTVAKLARPQETAPTRQTSPLLA